MIRVIPILLAVLYGLAMYRFSAWRTAKELDEKSTELIDPALREMSNKMAKALDVPRIKVHIYEVAPVNGLAALGHSRRRMIDFSGQNAMRAALGMILGRLIPGVGIWIANMLASMLAARLSRSDEYEADAYAAALLTKAGIGVAPQISLFQKLEALTQTNHGTAPAWLMSHPKTDDRIAALTTLQKRWDV